MAAQMRCHYQGESLIHLILITPYSHYQRDSLIQLTLITAFYLCLTQKSPGDLYQGWIPNLTDHKVHFKLGRFMFQFDCKLSEYDIQNLGWELKIQNITNSMKKYKMQAIYQEQEAVQCYLFPIITFNENIHFGQNQSFRDLSFQVFGNMIWLSEFPIIGSRCEDLILLYLTSKCFMIKR